MQTEERRLGKLARERQHIVSPAVITPVGAVARAANDKLRRRGFVLLGRGRQTHRRAHDRRQRELLPGTALRGCEHGDPGGEHLGRALPMPCHHSAAFEMHTIEESGNQGARRLAAQGDVASTPKEVQAEQKSVCLTLVLLWRDEHVSAPAPAHSSHPAAAWTTAPAQAQTCSAAAGANSASFFATAAAADHHALTPADGLH
mmetsp:Transcript_9375/g.14916  ORF Transcript_9375/g.14916 Transcript_9375/m.14916 type:complete len:202 (-) Transcript_9375:823-1428(-)